MRRAFLFQPKDTDKYVSPEILSPEALLLGDHAGRGGLLRHRNYLTGDKRWTQMATFARSTMRLTAYSGPLTYRAMQAAERQVTQEDHQLLDSLLLAITELIWKQSTRAALFNTRRRRDLVLSALGFPDRQHAQLVRDLPFEGPLLFSGFLPLGWRSSWRSASRHGIYIAGQLRQVMPHRPRGTPQARPPSYGAALYRAFRAPTRRRRPSSHPAHAPSLSSRHGSGDYRLAQQGGNRQEVQSLHRVSTFQNGDASVYPSLPGPGRLDCLHRSLRHISSCA